MFRAALMFAVLFPFAGTSLEAQASPVRATIDSGVLIRMHPTEGAAIRGRLVQPLGPTSVTAMYCRYPAPPCTDPADTASIHQLATRSLVRIDVENGTNWRTGGIIGAVVGALLGALAAELQSDCDPGTCSGASPGGSIVIGAFVVGGIGALIGSSSPRWGPAP